MIKIDLHTHSEASPDGGIKLEQYIEALEDGLLDYVAVTDHDSIALAVHLNKQFPDKVIVGEEIMSTDGELIGLFLTSKIEPGQTALKTALAIKAQKGLVYIPHPFETVRHGLQANVLDEIAMHIDIIEVHNGRALLQNHGPKVATWAKLNRAMVAASSDAHGVKGLGTTYTIIQKAPTSKNLVELLSVGRPVTNRPPLRTLLYPKAHRLRKRFL